MKLSFKLTRLIILTSIFSLLMITSCQKESSKSATDSAQEMEASQASGESDVDAEMVFNGIFDDAIGVNNDVGMAGIGLYGRTEACYIITVTNTNPNTIFPIKIVVDFGTIGCLGNDGHVRKGKVITEYTSRLILAGAVATTTFDGFYIDSVKVEGVHKITNTSTSLTSRQFTVDITDAKLSRPSGNYTKWNSHKVITQTEGLSTIDYPRDDIFKVEGSARGEVKRDALLVAWESNITEPLVKKFVCHWLVKGKVKTVRINTSTTGPWVSILDFGAGDCDNQAVLTINGVSHNISLH